MPEVDKKQRQAAVELVAQIELATLGEVEQRVYDYFLGTIWLGQRPEQCVAAASRPGEHRDGVLSDLLDRVDLRRMHRLLPRKPTELQEAYFTGPPWSRETARQVNAISPGNPEAVALVVRADPPLALKLFEPLRKKYWGQPQVLRALAVGLYRADRRNNEALAEYIKYSPDQWAYGMLCRARLDEGSIDGWMAVLDEYVGTMHGGNVDLAKVLMARFLMDRGEFEKARRYAEAAATAGTEDAMGCLVRCYELLGKDEQEGVWRERMSEKYPTSYNARELYLWCRRTGLGDVDQAADLTKGRIGPKDLFGQGNTQTRYAAFYWLSGERKEALRTYQLGIQIANDPTSTIFNSLCAALVADELEDQASRDAALTAAAGMQNPPMPDYQKVANLLAAALPAKRLNTQEAQRIAADARDADKPGVNFVLGYALLVVGQKDDAVSFLQAAATHKLGAGSTSRTMAIAAMRDRGLSGKGRTRAE